MSKELITTKYYIRSSVLINDLNPSLSLFAIITILYMKQQVVNRFYYNNITMTISFSFFQVQTCIFDERHKNLCYVINEIRKLFGINVIE